MNNNQSKSRFGRAVAAGSVALVVAGAGVAKAAAHHADDLPMPKPGTHVPVPHPPVHPSDAQVNAQVVRILQPVRDLPDQEAAAFVNRACQAVDIYGALTGSYEDMALYVVGQQDSFAGWYAQAYELVSNLAEAETALDKAKELAKISLCTWAAEHA